MPTNSGFILGSTIDNSSILSLINSGLDILFILAFGMYVIFSFVATRQIHTMKNTLITPFSGLVQLLGYLHLAASIFVLVAFILSP